MESRLAKLPPDALYRIGMWSVEPQTGRIVGGSEERRLRPQLMDLLLLMADRAGQVVTKQELLAAVWRTRFISDSSLTRSIAELRRLLDDSDQPPRYIETIPKRGYRLVAPVRKSGPAPPRLAVLPFDNLSNDPEEDYFAEGTSDSVITELGKIGSLRVISRQSVLQFRRTERDLPGIARQLKVDAIVEGSILLSGNRVRITAQLLQADPEQHLWADSYECHLVDALSLQSQVARSIARAVQAALTGREIARLPEPRRANPEAHLAYLKGRYHALQWTQDGIQKGVAYLERAIAIDPTYAPAWDTLAHCFVTLGYWGHMPTRLAYPRAKQTVLKALELDDSLSQAHASLALIHWLLDWDTAGWEREALRAIELNPSSEYAHFVYALFLINVRRDPKASIEQGRIGLDLDPLSVNSNFSLAWLLVFAGEYEEAVEQALKTLELHPAAIHAYNALGWAYVGLSRFAEAIASLEKAIAMAREPVVIACLANIYGRCGRPAEAQALVAELEEGYARGVVQEMTLVVAYAGLADLDRAFASLEKCCDEHDSGLFGLSMVPPFEPLHSDPRYHRLLKRLGLPAGP